MYNVSQAPADQQVQEAFRAGGRLAGGAYGASLLAPYGAPGGPWGVAGTTLLGGLIGSFGGEAAVDGAIEFFENPPPMLQGPILAP